MTRRPCVCTVVLIRGAPLQIVVTPATRCYKCSTRLDAWCPRRERIEIVADHAVPAAIISDKVAPAMRVQRICIDAFCSF